MKYQLIGRKIPDVGKPLWEILGNLKNFGVGRLLMKSTMLKYPEPSFFRILKVQPLPPPKSQFEDRDVLVWSRVVHRGKIIEVLEESKNMKPNFILIPKHEEEKYMKIEEEVAKHWVPKTVPKYSPWPPLYKILWEAQNLKQNKSSESIPKLKTKIIETSKSLKVLGEADETSTPCNSDLYVHTESVHDMIEEIVRLQKKINANSL